MRSQGDESTVTERLHLLDVPGGRPIHLGFLSQDRCESCVVRFGDLGEVVHAQDCKSGRQLAATAASFDITGRGGIDLAEQARRAFAVEYAEEVTNDDERMVRLTGTADLSDGELTLAQGELAQASSTRRCANWSSRTSAARPSSGSWTRRATARSSRTRYVRR